MNSTASDLIFNSFNVVDEVSNINKNTNSISNFDENNLQSFNQNTLKINSIPEKERIINEIKDTTKCYICLETIKNPKMCNYCHRLACEDCISKWIRTKNECGFCRHPATRFDYIQVYFMNNVPKLLEYNNNLEIEKSKLETQNKLLNEKLLSNQCSKHKEKILFYCFNCNQKLCGKCTAFNNEESKIHIGHKIFEYSEIEKSKYKDVINQLDDNKKIKKELHDNINKCQEFKKINKEIFEKEKIILDYIFKEIEYNYKLKNNKILENEKKLNNLYRKIDENCKNIQNNLNKIESLDKPINGLDKDKIKQEFEKMDKEQKSIEEKMKQNLDGNILIELKSFKFIFNKSYESIKKEVIMNITINNPIKIDFSLELEKDQLFIYFPVSVYINEKSFDIEIKDTFKKKINLFPILEINNKKIEEFKKVKKQLLNFVDSENNIINNDIDEDDEKDLNNIIQFFKLKNNNINNNNNENENIMLENKDNKEEEFEYMASIDINDIIKGNNIFSLFIYYCSFHI